MGGLRGRRPRSAHRLALAPACWGIHEAGDWGHQIDAERVLSEAAAVGEGAITAGPPGFLPDRSDHTKALLRRHRLQVVAGEVQAILHHHETRGAELAHIDGHAHWLSAIGGSTLVVSAIPERTPGATRPDTLSNAQWAHLLHLIGSVEHVCARHRLKLAVQPRFGSTIQGPEEIELAAGRIQHVHLNDVDLDLARRVRDLSLDYKDAVSRNLYTPIGEGGA